MSWGGNDTIKYNGYIAINGNKLMGTTRGFTLVRLSSLSCSASDVRSYDTFNSVADGDNMATYINNLPQNTVLVGVTTDEARYSLSSNGISALTNIGLNVSALQFCGKMAFVVKKGQPASTVSQVAPSAGSNVKIIVNVTGGPCLIIHYYQCSLCEFNL